MAGLVELTTPTLDAEPGEEAEVGVLVYNTSSDEEAYELEILGPVAPWAFLDPTTVRLPGGGAKTARLVLRPPRDAEVPAGPTPFTVRLTCRADLSVEVAEGTVDVAPYEAFTARLAPDVIDAGTSGRTRVEITNDGNVAIVVNLEATSPDGSLGLKLEDETVLVPAGTTAAVRLTAKPRHRRMVGRGQPAAYGVRLESLARVALLSGRVQPKGALPALLARGVGVAAALVAVVSVAFLAFGGGDDDQLTSKGLPRSIRQTTVPPPEAIASITGSEEPPAAAATTASVVTAPAATATTAVPGAGTGTLPPPPPEVRGPAKVAPLRRFYDPAVVDYVYTADDAEAARLLQAGLVEQGTAGKVLTARQQGTAALYRLRRSDGKHLFTFDEAERRAEVLKGAVQEGIAGFLYPNPVGGTTPLYRLSKDGVGYLTADNGDLQSRIANGWVNEGVRGYVLV